MSNPNTYEDEQGTEVFVPPPHCRDCGSFTCSTNLCDQHIDILEEMLWLDEADRKAEVYLDSMDWRL